MTPTPFGLIAIIAFGVCGGILMAVGVLYWAQQRKSSPDGPTKDRLNDPDWWKRG